MNQVKGWEQVQQMRIDRLCHKVAARRVALGALETLLNVIINNAVAEEIQKQQVAAGVVVLAQFKAQKEKAKKPSRRTYYAVLTGIIGGEVHCHIYCKKPTNSEWNYVKVRASKRTEARLIVGQRWNKEAA